MVVIKEDERLAFSHGCRDKHFISNLVGGGGELNRRFGRHQKLFFGDFRMNTLLGSLIAFDLGKNCFIFKLFYPWYSNAFKTIYVLIITRDIFHTLRTTYYLIRAWEWNPWGIFGSLRYKIDFNLIIKSGSNNK